MHKPEQGNDRGGTSPEPQREPPFERSDAWLLLAVIYVGVDAPAGREQIVEAGDYINRAVFSEAEFAGGMERLLARGCVVEAAGRYAPSPDIVAWFRKECHGRSPVRRDLERLERFLGLPGDS